MIWTLPESGIGHTNKFVSIISVLPGIHAKSMRNSNLPSNQPEILGLKQLKSIYFPESHSHKDKRSKDRHKLD